MTMNTHTPLNYTFIAADTEAEAVTGFTRRYKAAPAYVVSDGRYYYAGPVPSPVLETVPVPAHFLDEIAEVRNAH